MKKILTLGVVVGGGAFYFAGGGWQVLKPCKGLYAFLLYVHVLCTKSGNQDIIIIIRKENFFIPKRI